MEKRPPLPPAAASQRRGNACGADAAEVRRSRRMRRMRRMSLRISPNWCSDVGDRSAAADAAADGAGAEALERARVPRGCGSKPPSAGAAGRRSAESPRRRPPRRALRRRKQSSRDRRWPIRRWPPIRVAADRMVEVWRPGGRSDDRAAHDRNRPRHGHGRRCAGGRNRRTPARRPRASATGRRDRKRDFRRPRRRWGCPPRQRRGRTGEGRPPAARAVAPRERERFQGKGRGDKGSKDKGVQGRPRGGRRAAIARRGCPRHSGRRASASPIRTRRSPSSPRSRSS